MGSQEKCEDLEERNRELTDESRVAELEAELIAVKLREAEANNAMKELAHKVNLLQHAYKVSCLKLLVICKWFCCLYFVDMFRF